jgi:hypothetical protein
MSAQAGEDEGLAALALIRAYAARDMYTARHILARWDTHDRSASFSAVVATVAASLLQRTVSADHDRDRALALADEALDIYQGLVLRDRAA